MSYSVRDIGVPFTMATGAATGLSAAGAGAGAAACCVLPQAVKMATAATVDTTVHVVRKNWLIGILFAKKRLWPTWPVRPGAAVYDNSGRLAKKRAVSRPEAPAPRWRAREYHRATCR